MITEGYEVPEDWRRRAIRWCLEDPRGFETARLVGMLLREAPVEISGPGPGPGHWPRAHRLADRIIQHLRKEGTIKRTGKIWIPT